jgi:hypothetical protein
LTRLSIATFLLLAALFIVLGSAGDAAAASAAECLQMDPPFLERTLFLKASHTMIITGPCPEGSQIVLKVVSPTRDFRLNKSGKGLGFVWLPVGHAEVKEIPVMYQVLSSAKISDILSPAEQEAVGLTSDLKEIYDECKVHFDQDIPHNEIAGLRQEYVSGLIKIFKDSGLYQRQEGAVQINGSQFSARSVQPSDAPLGEYKVFCYAVQDGKARLIFQDKFLVKSGALSQWLAYHAQASPVVYGVLAAVIAVAAGLLVGAVFRKGGSH